MELLKSDDEVRLLTLDAAELQRGILAARKQQPVVPQLDTSIMLLKKQLLDAQRQAAELSTALETPHNKSRYDLQRLPACGAARIAKTGLFQDA